jgi:hypothetical protein
LKTKILISVLLIGLTCLFPQSREENYTQQKIERYKKYAAVKPAFIPLEIGEVTPNGWLLDWANTAADGITGHLDEYVDVFKHGWKGYGFKAKGVNEDGTGWPLEQCSYWLDGALKLGYILRDTALINKTSARLDLVIDGVLNGGETFIYWKPKSIVENGFNNWGHALMGRALVSYYQASHNQKALKALVKVYKSFPLLFHAEEGLKSLNKGAERMRGATNIDAMTETFLMSGEKTILDSIIAYAGRAETEATVNQWLSFKKGSPAKKNEGLHGVSFYELMRAPAMLYSWTGDENKLNASRNFLEWGEAGSLLPIGICSSEEYLAGSGSFRNAETCNVPTSMWSFLWMLRLTGGGKWSDKTEQVFFNAAPAPVARNFKTMCYYQSPNRFSNKLPEEPPIPGSGDLTFTDHGHEVLCCVGNINNAIPNYISNMWMATLDNGLAAVLYGPCNVQTKINSQSVKIECATGYPFEEKIEMKVFLQNEIEMPLYFRIPEWCAKASIKINGAELKAANENGFVKVSRVWKNNDKIVIELPMAPQIRQGNETPYPQVSYFLNRKKPAENQKAAVDTTVNNPYETVTYGPLLFALPIADINPNQESQNAKYNYALNINPKHIDEDIEVIIKPLSGSWSWQPAETPVQLRVKAKEISWAPGQLNPLPAEPVNGHAPALITLIPYGCTKFRVSMFPVTKETWRASK